MKTSLWLMAIVCLSVFSCTKDDVITSKPLTPTTANIVGNYKISKVMAQQGTGPASNITDSYFAELCERDNLYCLKANNVFETLDAGLKCSPSADRPNGYWKLVNPSTLEIDGEISTIQTYNGKNLDLTVDYGGGVTITRHYIKQ